MKTSMTVTRQFDSSHEDESCSPYLHGHTFTVSAEGPKNMGLALEAVVAELHLRELGRMLNGGSQRIDGLAAWFLERLMVEHPDIDSVSVGFLQQRATVTREKRR